MLRVDIEVPTAIGMEQSEGSEGRDRVRLSIAPSQRAVTAAATEDDSRASGSAAASPNGEEGRGERGSGLRVAYRSSARVVLLGTGADELFGGYGRHKTVFRKDGWEGLSSELKAERERLWLRNLGRDDRVISDWAREARHPYLDEGVLSALSEVPLHHICDLRQTLGLGDKLILRRLARLLGLSWSASLQKRAIQFGTRIANKNVCGQARLGDVVDLAEVVHPDAECHSGKAGKASNPKSGAQAPDPSAVARGGDAATRDCLSKKRTIWPSARAAEES